jgi:choice-of-anchor C domain-containing protein
VNNSVLLISSTMNDWHSAGGQWSLLLQGEDKRGGIEQTFPTIKGWHYKVSFALAANPNLGRWSAEMAKATIEVSAAGQKKRFTFDGAGKTEQKMGWRTNEWEFEATGDKTTLAFSAAEAKGYWHGPALDNVRVVAVPPPNLLVNGGFEEGPVIDARTNQTELKDGSTALKGWKVTGSVLLDRADWEHAEGVRSILLHSPGHQGGIEQTFATTKGQRYRVSFALSANPNLGRWGKDETATAVRVGAAGKSQRFDFDCAGRMPYDMGWATKAWEFEATGDETTLRFATEETNKGYWHGPALDDVRVWAVPGGPMTPGK